MAYNILGINPGHNGSVALVSNGKLIHYLEEERLSRRKRDNNPIRSIIELCTKYKIDEIAVGGTHYEYNCPNIGWVNEDIFTNLVKKYHPEIKTTHHSDTHHHLHALMAFINSSFNKCSI